MSLSSPGRKSTGVAGVCLFLQVKGGEGLPSPLSSIRSFSHTADLLTYSSPHD